MKKCVITIGRQCGSGGHTIGKTVAENVYLCNDRHLPMSVFVSCMKFWADIGCKFVVWSHHDCPYLPYP